MGHAQESGGFIVCWKGQFCRHRFSVIWNVVPLSHVVPWRERIQEQLTAMSFFCLSWCSYF